MAAYYNEIDPYAAQWLRNLIANDLLPAGDVDERSIVDVKPDDLRGYQQAHFFAGIGGWPYALRLADWPDDRPVWTGSCPCQKFSGAARGQTVVADDLWPAWLPLIASRRPRALFGEQVAQKGSWLDQVCDDLGKLDYEIGAVVLPAISIGKDHIRNRIYFAGHANGNREPIGTLNDETSRLPGNRSHTGSVVQQNGLPSRVAILRAFGNAIVPQVAAEFIKSFSSAIDGTRYYEGAVHACAGAYPLSNIPDGRGWGPSAELNELRRRIERLEQQMAHVLPDKSSDV